MHYIYIIRNNINDKIYVGQTKNLHDRWVRHKSGAKAPTPPMMISRAIKKYGYTNFSFTPIEEWKTQEEADTAEAFWIKLLETMDTKIGYNIKPGGNTAPMTAKTRAKLSVANKGKPGNTGSFQVKLNWPEDKVLLAMVNSKGLGIVARELDTTASNVFHRLQVKNLHHDRSPGNTETKFKKGANHSGAKLTPNQVLEIVALHNAGDFTQSQLGRLFGVDRMNIKKIITGQTWNHITNIK